MTLISGQQRKFLNSTTNELEKLINENQQKRKELETAKLQLEKIERNRLDAELSQINQSIRKLSVRSTLPTGAAKVMNNRSQSPRSDGTTVFESTVDRLH